MKPWMLIPLLLLSLLQIHEAQGIRLTPIRTPSDIGHNFVYRTFQGRSNDIGVEEVILCRGYHCSGSWVRKLMVSPISSTTTTTKIQNDKNKTEKGTKEEKLSINSSSQRQPTVTEIYPGILDIAGMDYSQARRKPPIHN